MSDVNKINLAIETEIFGKTLSHCHFVYQKLCIDKCGVKPGPVTNGISRGTTLKRQKNEKSFPIQPSSISEAALLS